MPRRTLIFKHMNLHIKLDDDDKTCYLCKYKTEYLTTLAQLARTLKYHFGIGLGHPPNFFPWLECTPFHIVERLNKTLFCQRPLCRWHAHFFFRSYVLCWNKMESEGSSALWHLSAPCYPCLKILHSQNCLIDMTHSFHHKLECLKKKNSPHNKP